MNVNSSLYKDKPVNPAYGFTCSTCGIIYMSPSYAKCSEGEPLYWFRTDTGVEHFCGPVCASRWHSKNTQKSILSGPPYLLSNEKI